ncbi:AhpC/TSA antioxidant enzyme-domain-containing protein [Elsinoe ampelina]|uniref:AhpC/TSA antioxidant enzyme-domain-containing protein n=1 Tax=Elsinoe ampelina TaxID=302913 RepID=A0A6A6GP65_9PEZI|nr:AhpC/TSA antioxidant enzyme-domain-containing protein [Elsinoe ampelina]
MEGARSTARPHIRLDQFDEHPFSYPYLNTIASSSSSANESPTTSHPPVSSISPPSQRSSHTSFETSYETSWFVDEDSKPPTPPSIHGNDSVITHNTSFDDSCQFDTNDWFAQFDGQLDISDDPPSREALQSAGEIPVYDAAGNSRPFKSLYSLGDVVGDRQLIIFIRHFYCGACKAYIRALINTINAQTYFTMPVPTSIVVIGCGKPELIRQYKATTQCPFPIFADPDRQIFKTLGMGITWNMLGPKRPEYMKDVNVLDWANGQVKEVAHVKGKKRFMGGNLFQIGGEFLFQEGQVVWCHRMRNYRGHAEMDVIRRILDIER